jgi:DNA-binding winged helix-turn-helix (wHTH) protein
MNLRIGDWLLNIATGELTQGEITRQLTPKSTALLRTLAARPGDMLTKEELLDSVWRGTVVSDAALTGCIRELRRAFADDPKRPHYIETLHRRGYRLIAAVSGQVVPMRMPTQEPAGAHIAGRERELAMLRSTFERALAGLRQVVFVTGDPGIGKSALVEAFVNDTVVAPARVARGQCIEHYGPAEAYLPVIEALERLCRDEYGERTKQVLAKHAPGWLAQMPGLLSNAELRALMQRTVGVTPQRLMRELTDGLEVLSTQAPLLLLFEDLHWSDNATLDWLAFLARRRQAARLLVIGTYRRVEALARTSADQRAR